MYIYLVENLCYTFGLLVCKKYSLEINSCCELLSYIASLMFLGAIILYINKKDISYLNINFKYFSKFIIVEFIILLATVFIINTVYKTLFNLNYTFEHYQLMLSIVVILLILIISASFGCCLFLYLKQIEKEFSSQQIFNLIEKEYLNMLKQRDNEIRKFQHDINKHLSMLQLLLENKEYKQVNDYLQELNNNYLKIKKIYKTGNEIVDLIINKKIQENPQVSFNLKGGLPEQIAVSQYDICTILLNILDNAIEANKRNQDKYIDIIMGYYKDYISIIISNPTEIENVSAYSKKDKTNHGYGLINVKETLAKYEHQFDISYDKQCYQVNILLRYK
ncbi:sensor histidine kinase [Clostridioides difficile]|nr:GHKL domain-containing protein [Clostridioides difficile]HBH1378643.1 GHKL domain-containing protein [Clostridioides difficile]HBH1400813.1 GHKL domain-containing protein [Clostridioides difficile]